MPRNLKFTFQLLKLQTFDYNKQKKYLHFASYNLYIYQAKQCAHVLHSTKETYGILYSKLCL